MNIFEIKKVVQDCNLNFLIGSGLSGNYLSTLGNIESLLTELSDMKNTRNIDTDQEEIIRVSIYKKYFDEVISKNLDIIRGDIKAKGVLEEYKNFLKNINSIIFRRKSSILDKQINLFTTNIDIFLEKSLEETGFEFNDGFSGRYYRIFDLNNFKKSIYKTSLHFGNTYELPVFNLMKIHGSLSWEKEQSSLHEAEPKIIFSSDLKTIESIKKVLIPKNCVIKFNKNDTLESMLKKGNDSRPDESIKKFIEEYEKLSVVNPTKEKFKETVLNRNYYEILRIYSNELEKENSVLFVMGFSFSDEHIREITLRVANSNPTLKIYIFSHSNAISAGMQKLKEKSTNNNIKIITPELVKNSGKDKKIFRLDLGNINKRIFNRLVSMLIDQID